MSKDRDARPEFPAKVIQLIQAIPRGKVATYGSIAALAGKPRAARTVGWLLHSSSEKHRLPWQRVIKSDGRLSFPALSAKYAQQKHLLEIEGVLLANGRVDMKKDFFMQGTKHAKR